MGNFDLLSAKGIFLHMDLILQGFFFFPFVVSFTFWGLFDENTFYKDRKKQKSIVPFSLFYSPFFVEPFSLIQAFFLISSEPT